MNVFEIASALFVGLSSIAFTIIGLILLASAVGYSHFIDKVVFCIFCFLWLSLACFNGYPYKTGGKHDC